MDRTGNLHLHGSKYQRAVGMAAWDALCFAQEAEPGAGYTPDGAENGHVQGDNAPDVTDAWSHGCGLMGKGESQYWAVPFRRRKLA